MRKRVNRITVMEQYIYLKYSQLSHGERLLLTVAWNVIRVAVGRALFTLLRT